MRCFFSTVVLILLFQNIYGQDRRYYDNLKNSKKNSIAYSKKMLSDLQGDANSRLDRLLIIEEQIKKEYELYSIITNEIKLIDSELEEKRNHISSLQSSLKYEKDEYAKLINFTWLNKNLQDRMIFILSASNFNNAYKRIMYLKQLSDFRKATGNRIKNSIYAIDSVVVSLEVLKEEKLYLTSERRAVLDSLITVKSNFDDMSSVISGDIKAIIEELAKNQIKRENVKKHVAEHINKNYDNKKSLDESEDMKESKSFRRLKRKHIWPLKRFVVLHRFGDYRHPKFTNVVIKNDGVELGASPGSDVRAIYKGKVSNVISIPGEGHSIIIKHGEFYSVYANVVKPTVKQGDDVSVAQNIAKLKTGRKMTKMNFQLWYGKQKLNPKYWLKRR